MRFIYALLMVFVMSAASVAQDTIRIQTVRVDTVKIETVHRDTVFVQPVNTEKSVQIFPPQQAAQPAEPAKKPLLNRNKMYFGGYVNANFGSYTVIGVEPMMGYNLLKWVSLGAKVSYEYIKDKRYNDDYSANNYGFSLFSRVRLTQRLYAHVEYSAMNYKLYDSSGGSNRDWVPFLFVGGGLRQPVTKNTWFTAEVLFDVLQNENSPYAKMQPFFNVGFGVGF